MTISITHDDTIIAPNVEGLAWQHDRPACGYDPVSNTFLVAGNSLNDTVYRMDMNGIVMEVYDDFTHGIRAEEGAKIGTAGKMNFADFQWVRPDVWIVVMEYYYVGNASAYYTVFVEVDLNLGTAVRLPHIATGLVSTEINGWITPNPDGGYYVGQAYVQQVRNIGPNIFYVRDLRDQSPASWKRLVKYTADGHDNPTAKYGTIGFGAEFKVLAGQKWYHSSTVFGITTHGPYLFCWGVFSWGNPFYDNRGYLADHFKPVCLVYLRSELNGVNLQPQPIQMIDIDGILEPFAKEGMRSNYRFGVTQNGDIVHL
ncbi:MAG: hypothetical protein O2856_03995 [Planctomycetota bacterium]|nr:hypothetical protein [Planctomycetota bacterium]